MNSEQFFSQLATSESQDVLDYMHEFEQLVPKLDLEGLLIAEMRRCQESHRYIPNVRSGISVVLHRGGWFTVELVALDLKSFATEVTTDVSNVVYHFLTPVTFRKYDLVEFQSNQFSPDARARLVGEGTLPAGTTVGLESTSQVMSICSPDPMVFLTLSNSRKHLFSWDFSAEDGRPIQHYHNRPVATAMELMAKLIGCYGEESSVPTLVRLLDHESDTVKWQAATALLRIDSSRGLSSLHELRASANPYLKSAATQSLQLHGEAV